MKLWEGRFTKEIDKKTNDFNSSISFDSRMIACDIKGSVAHAKMLGKQGIITAVESEKIVDGLMGILNDYFSGALVIDMEAEDIHTFVESQLIARIGDSGKRLHTGRSRNDQVALDIRLYLKDAVGEIKTSLIELIEVLCDKSTQHSGAIMPSYTHLQRAQPITFGHHLMAYSEMFLRDIQRLDDACARLDISPLGSGALAGTTYPLDRDFVASELGMAGLSANSLDGVSDRDFAVELVSAMALIMVHLSRFSEEIILWCSWEFKFIELDDAFSTGSSIMPQKKNPDIAELVRGKSGRVFGNLNTLLVMLKGIPLAYNKDMQEDKEAVFEAFDTVQMCLTAFIPMIETMAVNKKNMLKAAAGGFINATDCADYLVKKGLPFRDAYKVTGGLVAYCIKGSEENKTLESLTLDEYKNFSDIFEEDIFEAISLVNCVNKRKVYGGPAPENVVFQASRVKGIISKMK